MPPPGINKSQDELIKMVRVFLGDSPEENKLTEGNELSDDKLRLSLDMALDLYNNTAPFENRTFETFPSLTLIIHGSVIQALMMAGIIQTRNHLNFSDGGIQEVISDKAGGYQAWIGQIVGAWRDEMLSIKTALNMEANFGIISSPYGNTFDSDFS